MTSHKTRNLKITLFIIFAFSGFSGLIYESIWTHYIKLILGHAAYAQTLVLSIFMGGMAIGASLTARKNQSISTPLKFYAIVELVLGITAIAFHTIFIATESLLHEILIPSIDSVALIEIMRWSIAALLILPQSILLGTTFPLIGIAIIRLDKRHSGSTLGMLYFTNSIGAAIGLLVSAFLLINLLGLFGTIMTAGLINILIASVIWLISKSEKLIYAKECKSSATSPESKPTTHLTPKPLNSTSPNWLLGIALLTGLASFFYEIGWIRMLSLVLGSSMQAFEIMLSAFITGLALGGLWIRNRMKGIDNPAVFLGKIQIVMGLCAVATLPLYNSMFDFMGFMITSLKQTDGGYILFNLTSHFVAMLIMFPAAFMAGTTLPLITYTLLQWKQGERSIGRVYAFNTIGAISGVLLAVHIAMPLIGTKGLIISGAVVDVALGLFLLAYYLQKKPSINLKITGVFAVISMLLISFTTIFDLKKLSSGVFRHGKISHGADSKVLFYQDGKTASISVIETNSGARVISTNGKPDASINPTFKAYSPDEITMIMLAALPLAIHPQAKKLANIGMGSGLTTHTLLFSPLLSQLDTIEIEPKIIEGLQQFGKTTDKALNDPRSNIIIDDAKSFLSRNKTHYDIIVSEPSNPWVSGVAGLFSTEFYHHINRYLKDDGILVQWLQLYETNIELIASVFKALDANFNDYAVYATGNTDIIIVASNQRDVTNIDPFIFNNNTFSQQLSRANLKSPDDFRNRFIGNKQLLQPFFNQQNSPTNSDYLPYLSLNSPKARFLHEKLTELAALPTSPFPPAQLIEPIPEKTGEGIYFKGDIHRRASRQITNMLLTSEKTSSNMLSKDSRTQITLIKDTLKHCEPLTNRRSLFNDSLHTIAINTLPFVNDDKSKVFWQQIANHRCLPTWPERTRQWVKLYHSIMLKDHLQTVRTARELLLKHPTSSTERLTYVVGAATFAFLKQGRIDEAQQFRFEFFSHLEKEVEIPLYLEILFGQLDV